MFINCTLELLPPFIVIILVAFALSQSILTYYALRNIVSRVCESCSKGCDLMIRRNQKGSISTNRHQDEDLAITKQILALW